MKALKDASTIGVIINAKKIGEYLSEYQVAAYLGITNEDVTALIEAGELDGVSTKLGANYVFVKSKVDEWMENRVR